MNGGCSDSMLNKNLRNYLQEQKKFKYMIFKFFSLKHCFLLWKYAFASAI